MRVLYGSYARGDSRPGSDIDLALVLSGDLNKYEEIDRIVDATNNLSLENDVMISVLPLTLEEYRIGRYQIFNNIRREGVVV